MGYMPYQWEKGFFPTAVESWFNEGLDATGPADGAQAILAAREGPRRRLRAIWRYASVCRQLRDGAANPAAIRTVTKENSIIESSLFAALGDTGPMDWKATIARDWFGMEESGGTWYRQTTATWVQGKSLGHWNGYFGNVELIVCETLQRMLELSLGVPHLHLDPATFPAPVPSEADAATIVNQLRQQATHVWPVYLFLTCPSPWFEGWVTWQCHDTASAVRGQVTVMLSTPGHDRPVTPSPLDVVGDTDQLTIGGATTPNPYYLYGRDGYQGDYITIDNPASTGTTGTAGVVPATFRRTPGSPVKGGAPSGQEPARTHHQGMWLVTHANHDSTIVWNNFPEPTKPNWGQPNVESWDLPPFAVHRCADVRERRDLGGTSDPEALTGMDDVVVVQPARRDGGIW
ncbi:MAG TPA: hypothetical protein VFI47_08050 [Acidimicrobiales bacterium]|nr:hypothetical protein [Acidimicrobiales bacterium]